MSFLLTCPNCGEREVTDFAYGGEVVPRPATKPSERELNTYNYFRRNVAGRPARVVVSPLRLPRLVPRRARHDHQRGAVGRPPGAMSRLPPSAGERIDRERPLAFSFDGKPVEAFEGDTIGSALHAARPAGALAQLQVPPPARPPLLRRPVPELPRRRRRLARASAPAPSRCARGCEVKHMNASPSLRFDVMRATDLFGKRLTPPGFYYKTFIRPRRLWPLYEKVLRNAAGLGRLRPPPGRARVAHRVPAPPRRRARDRRRRRRDGRGAARRRARSRRGPGRRRPRARRRPLAGDGAGDARELAARVRAAGRRGAGAGGGARVLRRHRPGLARRAPCIRFAPRATSPPPARSSSR